MKRCVFFPFRKRLSVILISNSRRGMVRIRIRIRVYFDCCVESVSVSVLVEDEVI